MNVISTFRKKLSLPITSWQLCLLAIIGGIAAAFLVILFSLTIEALQQLYFTKVGDYNSSSFLSRLQLPVLGVLLILVLSLTTGYQYIRAGIPFVLHRLKVAYGVIPFRNTLNQFWGGAIALASGFSVGKEGPAVHLGAACAGYIGNKLNLPFNSIRTLCACGIAAGISACFNTPIAAVMFVMEVILREYKVHIFIPIMLSAIVGSIVTKAFLGPVQEFEFFVKLSLDLSYYPYLVIFGILLGVFASGFNHFLAQMIKRSNHIPLVIRLIAAALITGCIAYVVPNAVDIGNSSVLSALDLQAHWQLVVSILLAKVLMTIFALGLGIPGGIIGPILTIGAIAGVAASAIVAPYVSHEHFVSDFALMGMAGFMAATLNAPLAALLAVVELSSQLEVVLPAMIVIATSCLASGQFFKNRSIFIMQLNIQNLTYRKPPIEASLQKIGALGVMNEKLAIDTDLTEQDYKQKAINEPDNIVIKRLAGEKRDQFIWYQVVNNNNNHHVQLHSLIPLSSQSTLAEAYIELKNIRAGGVYIYHKDENDIVGMVSFDSIRNYLTEGKLR